MLRLYATISITIFQDDPDLIKEVNQIHVPYN